MVCSKARRQAGKLAGWQVGRQAGMQGGRHAGRQAGRLSNARKTGGRDTESSLNRRISL